MAKTKRSTVKKRRGGYANVSMCEYNVNDNNVRVNGEDPRELQGIYNTCCPKSRFGFKNSKSFCKNLAGQFKMLQQAKNYENDQIFKHDNDRYLNSDDEDYYKPRNAITNPDEEEFGPEFRGSTYGLGGRKTRRRKSRSRKSRKSRELRKSRKSRK